MDIKDLEKIIAILKQNDVYEFELEQNGTHIRLSRNTSVSPTIGAEPAPASAAGAQAGGRPAGQTVQQPLEHKQMEPKYSENLVAVESPIVGTFYRKPSPDADPFVSEGDRVKKGQTLCIVEAMKVMNEIEAVCDGIVEKVLLNDGQVVEYGEVLFLINPSK